MRHVNKYIILLTVFLLLTGLAFTQTLSETNYLTGKAKFDFGQYDSSLVYLDKALIINANNIDAIFFRGLALYHKSQYSMAVQDLEQVEKNSKGKASIWLARCYANLEDVDNCIKALEVHLTSNYRLPESTLLLDPDLAIVENDQKYISFMKSGTWYTGLDKTIAEAGYLMKSKQYPEAINVLSEGLKKGYRKAPLYAKRAEVYLQVSNYRLALDDLNQAIELDRRNTDILVQRANLLYITGKYKPAMEDYNSVLKLVPDDLNYYVGWAMSLNKSGFYDNAVRNMNIYLSYYPGNDSAWYQFGMIHYDNGNYFDAINCFNNSLKINQKDARYFASRGATYLKTRTYKYAWKDLAMALDLDPNDSQSYVNKGIAAINTGNNDDACFCFNMAKKLGNTEGFNYAEKYCK